MTLRYRAPSPTPRYPRGELAPGGRWERLLRRLHDDGPLFMNRLLIATDPGHHDREVERLKVKAALRALYRRGLIATTDAGWAITLDGRAALNALTGDRRHAA
jgi:hypothetical protein